MIMTRKNGDTLPTLPIPDPNAADYRINWQLSSDNERLTSDHHLHLESTVVHRDEKRRFDCLGWESDLLDISTW